MVGVVGVVGVVGMVGVVGVGLGGCIILRPTT